jgi:hypothetical protein
MNYLEGEQLQKRAAALRRHIGKRVQYLRECDIDKSGRGYFFPRLGRITKVHGRNIWFDESPEWLPDVREIVLINDKTT